MITSKLLIRPHRIIPLNLSHLDRLLILDPLVSPLRIFTPHLDAVIEPLLLANPKPPSYTISTTLWLGLFHVPRMPPQMLLKHLQSFQI